MGAGRKSNGFMMVSASLAAIVFILLASSLVGLCSGMFSTLKSGQTASVAQQYAEIEGNTLTLLSYDVLASAAHGRANIMGVDGWQSEVIIGPEKTIGNDNRQRIGTVKIYKSGEGIARSSLQVPLFSQGASNFPKGAVLPWYGNINDIPNGFHLCDGSNGTPDLRDRFLVGAGGSYSKGQIGGESSHTLTTAEMPSHNHSFAFNELDRGLVSARPDAGAWRGGENGGIDYWQLHTSINFPLTYVGGSQPHENRPPFFALYYIIKR